MTSDCGREMEQIRAELPSGYSARSGAERTLIFLQIAQKYEFLTAGQAGAVKAALMEDLAAIATAAVQLALDTGDLGELRRTVDVMQQVRRDRGAAGPRAGPGMRQERVLLFAAPGMGEVAANVATVSGGVVELGRIRWEKFADGFPNLFIEEAGSVAGRPCAFLADLHHPEAIFHQVRAPARACSRVAALGARRRRLTRRRCSWPSSTRSPAASRRPFASSSHTWCGAALRRGAVMQGALHVRGAPHGRVLLVAADGDDGAC